MKALAIAQERRLTMNEFKIRIAVEGIKELTEAIRMLAGIGGQQGSTAPQPDLPAPGHAQPQASAAPIPSPQNYGQPMSAYGSPVGQPPMQPSAPMGHPMQATQGGAAVSALPTTAVAPEYTLEQLQVAAAGLSTTGRLPQVVEALQRFGIQAMTELPKERYGEFAIALREAGAQI